MYYQNQIRNLAKQAELERQLLSVQLNQSKLRYDQDQNLRNSKQYTLSQSKRDKQISLYLERSRIQAELDASNVSNNAMLNRSRIQSALSVRQKNQQLNEQIQKSLVQQKYLQLASLDVQEQLFLETQKQREWKLLQQEAIREDLYRNISRESEQRVYYQLKEEELRRQVYEEQIKRQLKYKYGSVNRPYFYY